MDERRTESGLVVRENPWQGLPPRDNEPNANPPGGSVGPNADAGFGDVHAAYPGTELTAPPVQAWQGWPVGWMTPEWNASSVQSWMGRFVDTVFAAIDLNSSLLSTMPPYLVRNGRVLAPLAWMQNPYPELYASWEEFAKQLFWSFQLGEVFVLCDVRGDDGYPLRFRVLDPWVVSVDWVEGVRDYSVGGKRLDNQADMLHVRYSSFPGDARGHGPLEAGGARVLAASALMRYATDLATRGGVPWAVITHPDRLTPKQTRELQEQWLASRTAAMGLPAVMSGGIGIEAMQVNPRDMALLDLAQFVEARISTLLGVPPFLLGLPTGADSLTYSTTETLYDFHWRSSLRPKAQVVMSALSNWATWPGSAVELDRDEYVRPAFPARADAYATMFNIVDPATGERAITIEEIRTAERMLLPGSVAARTSKSPPQGSTP